MHLQGRRLDVLSELDASALELRLHELTHTPEHIAHRLTVGHRLWNAREAPVAFHKVHEPRAALCDGVDSVFHIMNRCLRLVWLTRIHQQLRCRGGERSDRRHRIHDFMREHPDQILPGLDLTGFQFTLNVLQRNDLEIPASNAHLRRENIEL